MSLKTEVFIITAVRTSKFVAVHSHDLSNFLFALCCLLDVFHYLPLASGSRLPH
jgi:hypothetical protein